MSSFLYHLGLRAARAKLPVVISWLLVLIVLGGAGAVLNQGTEDEFSIPGSPAQEALNHMNRVIPQTSGSQGQLVVVAPEDTKITDPGVRSAVEDTIDRIDNTPQVNDAIDPFDDDADGKLSSDGQAAIVQLQMDGQPPQIKQTTKNQLDHISDDLAEQLGAGSKATFGGDAFNDQLPGFGVSEVLGVIIALIVLLLMFRSLLAAGMPLLTALVGVGIAMGGTFLATTVVTISSTAPLLGVMLGLAVGIDYALFILSRHRDQLAEGLEVRESIGRATATAGSAVIFAGMTVMIALIGLFVAGIPFLTVMGIVAAIAVAIAVLVAVTLIPALLAMCGERLRPRSARGKTRRNGEPKPQRTPKHRISRAWVRMATKVPAVTVLLIVAGLGVCALPAQDLRLTLPSPGDQPQDTEVRQTYDTISEHFGPGYNAQVILTANIVSSHKPVEVVDDIADEVRELPGVAAVPIATPNEDGDTGMINIMPSHSAYSDQTKALVGKLRGMDDHFQQKYGVSTAVTGMTAVAIDVSDQLGDALLPFGLLVVGLSLILLAMVFRSIWVPVKAAVGYLLSVFAALGATSFVFQQGHFADTLNLANTGSVISFFPIVLMGVLFGLAMDYEVFLVTRIREEYVRSRDPHAAIEHGFVYASRVVVAAAVIMFAVFAAFVPEGNGAIKPIAFGLAVGVFVDAFIVRMTLVPAVLALLGKHAWWLPRRLQRKLPVFDAEGDALAGELELADWPSPDSDDAVNAAGLRLGDDRDEDVFTGVDIRLPRGGTLVVDGPAPSGKTALLYTLAGRVRRVDGDLKVLGKVLPQHAQEVRRTVALIQCRHSADPAADVATALDEGAELVLLDDADLVVDPETRARLGWLLWHPERPDGTPVSTALTCTSPAVLGGLLPPGAVGVTLPDPQRPDTVRAAVTSPDAEET